MLQKKKKRAPHIKGCQRWPLPLNISYSVDYRPKDGSDEDTEPTFVFIGATMQVVSKVFEKLCHGGYIMKRYMINMEHACAMRNGHHFWRIAVMPKECNQKFMGIEGLRTMIEWNMRSMGNDITYIPDYNKFINL